MKSLLRNRRFAWHVRFLLVRSKVLQETGLFESGLLRLCGFLCTESLILLRRCLLCISAFGVCETTVCCVPPGFSCCLSARSVQPFSELWVLLLEPVWSRVSRAAMVGCLCGHWSARSQPFGVTAGWFFVCGCSSFFSCLMCDVSGTLCVVSVLLCVVHRGMAHGLAYFEVASQLAFPVHAEFVPSGNSSQLLTGCAALRFVFGLLVFLSTGRLPTWPRVLPFCCFSASPPSPFGTGVPGPPVCPDLLLFLLALARC